MLKRTPLFQIHQQLGARLVEFGGWEMPVQYTGIIEEHLAVRQAAGLFDISHMGEVLFRGSGAGAFLNRLLTNDTRKLEVGQAQYSLMCNPQGGVIDDLYVFRIEPDSFLLVINASRIDADVAWIRSQLSSASRADAVQFEDRCQETAAVAVQGPKAAAFIDACFQGPSEGGIPVGQVSQLAKNQIGLFTLQTTADRVWVSRTGYTGEDGFEIMAPARLITHVWNILWERGSSIPLRACGLGARDTLRTEMAYPLYGHELDETTTPLEAGLGFFVNLEKGDFVGRSPLLRQKANGLSRKCVAFKMMERSAPPRPHYAIMSLSGKDGPIGTVASGTLSPSLGIGIGTAYVPPDHARPGTELGVVIRGKTAKGRVVPKPIYRKSHPPSMA